MIRLAICGVRGRMGQAVARLAAAAADVQLVAGIDRSQGDAAAAAALGCSRIIVVQDADAGLADVDVVIDFSSAETTHALAGCGDALAGKALVVGTTGLSDATQRALTSLTDRCAVLVAANFSIGVNLLLTVAEQIAAVLDAARYDVEIVEAHHGAKVDAPSGTALALARAIAAGRGVDLAQVRRDGRSGATGARPRGEIGLHALRGGSVVGEHHVHFLGANERVELVHTATDRTLFAEGALYAARWLAGKPPGRYAMRDVLGLGMPGHGSDTE